MWMAQMTAPKCGGARLAAIDGAAWPGQQYPQATFQGGVWRSQALLGRSEVQQRAGQQSLGGSEHRRSAWRLGGARQEALNTALR